MYVKSHRLVSSTFTMLTMMLKKQEKTSVNVIEIGIGQFIMYAVSLMTNKENILEDFRLFQGKVLKTFLKIS